MWIGLEAIRVQSVMMISNSPFLIDKNDDFLIDNKRSEMCDHRVDIYDSIIELGCLIYIVVYNQK